MNADARWNLKVSSRVDTNLRMHLAARGGKKGDLSKFVEKAVSLAMLGETVREIQDANQDLTEAEAAALIDEAAASLDPDRFADRSWANAG
jgi:Ribbon-helix-helix domain